MSTAGASECAVSKKTKHPYIPLSARKVERGRNYVSTIVNDQKTMMENLRFLRHQMEKEERQLQIMSDTLYKRSLPHRDTVTENQKHSMTSLEGEPYLPLYPTQTPSTNRETPRMKTKTIKTHNLKKDPVVLYKTTTTTNKQPFGSKELVLWKPNAGVTKLSNPKHETLSWKQEATSINSKLDGSWSREGEARWLELYQKYCLRFPAEAGLNGKDQVLNGTVALRKPATESHRDSFLQQPNDLLEVMYEKNGSRFHNYSGLGHDGKFLLKAVDSFYNKRYGGY